MRHTRVIDLQRQEVGLRIGGRRSYDVLALPGADFHDQWVAVAPCFADIGIIQHKALTHIERALTRIDIQQIRIRICIPCALQTRVQPCGTAYERKHLAPVQRRTVFIVRVCVGFPTIGRRVHHFLHTLIYRGNAGTNRLCALMFTCYTQIVQKVTNLSKSEQRSCFRRIRRNRMPAHSQLNIGKART